MADAGEDPTIFTAHCLPSDPRLWATVTNAYLGTRVYHDTLHVNGVYNGALGDTHRAVLPSPLNVQLEAPAGTGEQLTTTFVLDTNTGSHCRSCPLPLVVPGWWGTPSSPILAFPNSGCPVQRQGVPGGLPCELWWRVGVSWTGRDLGSPWQLSFLHRAVGLQRWVHLTEGRGGLHSPHRKARSFVNVLAVPAWGRHATCLSCPLPSPGSFLHTLGTSRFRASQCIYAHRTLPHVLAFSVSITRLAVGTWPITVLLRSAFSPDSPDLDLHLGPDFQGAR